MKKYENPSISKALNEALNETRLVEMALEEMPRINTDGGRNSYRDHLRGAKDLLVKIQSYKKDNSKDKVKLAYQLLKDELSFDAEKHASSWEADNINTDSICNVYDKCIKEFGDMYENIFSNTTYWDKKYYELYDLLNDLEIKSGLGIKYSRKFKNEALNESKLHEAKNADIGIYNALINDLSVISDELKEIISEDINDDWDESIATPAIHNIPDAKYHWELQKRFVVTTTLNNIADELMLLSEQLNDAKNLL